MNFKNPLIYITEFYFSPQIFFKIFYTQFSLNVTS